MGPAAWGEGLSQLTVGSFRPRAGHAQRPRGPAASEARDPKIEAVL